VLLLLLLLPVRDRRENGLWSRRQCGALLGPPGPSRRGWVHEPRGVALAL